LSLYSNGAHFISKHTINSISPADFHRLIQDDLDIELIDVRPRKMYDGQRVEHAKFVEFTTLDPKGFMESRESAESAPLYIICQVGIRSVEACEQFIDAGFDNVVNIEGGTKAWAKENLPTIGVKKGFSCPIRSLLRRLFASK